MARIKQIMICPNQLSKHARASCFSCLEHCLLFELFLDEIISAFYLFFPGLQKPSLLTMKSEKYCPSCKIIFTRSTDSVYDVIFLDGCLMSRRMSIRTSTRPKCVIYWLCRNHVAHEQVRANVSVSQQTKGVYFAESVQQRKLMIIN